MAKTARATSSAGKTKAKVVQKNGNQKAAVRERARKKQKMKWRRYSLTVGSIMAILLTWFGYEQRVLTRLGEWGNQLWLDSSASAGFQFQELIVQGRELTPPHLIVEAVGLTVGDSLFLVSLEDIRSRLMTLETVKEADVSRDLSGRIIVTLAERKPFAIWQHDKHLRVIDDEGVVLSGEDPAYYPDLITVVGNDAPAHIHELVSVLVSDAELTRKVTAAVFISNRRWDVHFDNDIQIMLPELNPIEAWKKLAQMNREHGILQQKVEAIDLRITDRVFITLPEDATADDKAANDV